MRDIENRKDVEFLVDSFYKKALKDEVIGFFFTEVAQMDWDTHIPIMYNFWEGVLFGKGSYKGNPVKPHIDLHLKHPIKKEHFDRWISLFTQTVLEYFSGPTSEMAITRAKSIASIMQLKVVGS